MKLEVFFNNFDHLADAPDGIGKMRELILQLATRGKLIEQSSDDEPASALVARIEKHIEVLRGRKEFRGAPVEALDRDELPEIPSSWEWVRLGNVVDYGSSDKAESAAIPEDAWLLDLEDIEKDTSRLLQRKSFRDSPSKSTKTVFTVGDVLYGKLRPYLNKVIVADAPGYCTTEIIPIRAFGFIDSAYLCHALKRPEFIAYANSKSYGMNLPRLGTEDARNAPFPLPPLAEQKRIVAKVDELMALCDRLEAHQQEREARHAALARASLARFADAPTPANLPLLFHPSYAIPAADLRKSILNLAVQGKLVPQDPNDELSNSIPELIPSPPPLDVPDSWRWTEFGEIGEISGGFAFRSGDYTPKGIFILRVTNIAPSGVISKDEAVFLPPEKVTREVERFYLNEGDILLVMVGGSLGKIGVVKSDILPALLNQNLWRITPANREVDSQFLRLITDFAVSFQRQITNSTHGHLSREEFRKKSVAFPPLAEQRRIVAKVKELMALVDELESQLAASRAAATILLSALVAELTTKD